MVPYFNTTTTTTKKGLKPEKVKDADQQKLKFKELTWKLTKMLLLGLLRNQIVGKSQFLSFNLLYVKW